MKIASLAIEGLRHFAARGWRANVAAYFIGFFLRLFSPRKAIALTNLRYAFPKKTERERREILRKMYRHLSWLITEQLALQRDPKQALEWVDEVVGEEYVQELLKAGKGIVILAGHFGNWELFLSWGAQRGYPIYTIARGPNDPDLDKLLMTYRTNGGAEVFDRRDKTWSIIGVVKSLKRGKFFAAMSDIHEGSGIKIPLFGRDCWTPTAAATFALLADVPIIPYFLYRKAPFSHRAEIGEPIKIPESGNREEKIEAMTREMNERFEAAIKKDPSMWFWMHRRWKE